MMNRRKFIKTGVLTAAGVVFGNARSARASARKEWNVKVARSLRKFRAPKPTVCRMCTAHCAILAYRDGDRVVQIQGNPGSPTNQGGICARAFAGLERVYDPERILTPLARTGPRGSGQWEPITWEEALSRIKVRLFNPRAKKILHLAQEENMVAQTREVFGWKEILVDEPSQGHPGPGSGVAQYGAPIADPDVLHARTIFLFGYGALGGNFRVPLARNLMAAKEKGADIQLFDSVAGPTGSVAAWNPTYPGTEREVALGIARLLFKWNRIDYKSMARAFCPSAENNAALLDELDRLMLDRPTILVDRALVKSAIGKMPENPVRARAMLALMPDGEEKRLLRGLVTRPRGLIPLVLELANVLDELEATLTPFTPEYVMEYSRFPAATLIRMARKFADRRPALAVAAPGSPAMTGASLLNHMVGAVNTTGGAATARGPFFVTPVELTKTPETWLSELSAGATKADLYWAVDANPAYNSPSSGEVVKALKSRRSVGMVVVMDTHLTETAMLADIFLPMATSFESWSLLEGSLSDGRSYLFIQQPVTRAASEASKLKDPSSEQLSWFEPWAKPLGQARDISDLLTSLAHEESSSAMRFSSTRDYLGYLLIKSWGPGSLESLRARGIWVSEEGRSTNKREVVSYTLNFTVYPDAPPEGLRLVGYSHETIPARYPNTRLGREILHHNDAYMHPETAAAMGLKNGDKINLVTDAGKAEVRLTLKRTIHPETVAMVDGLGHTASGSIAQNKNVPRAMNGEMGRKDFPSFPFGLKDSPPQSGEELWWAHSGPGASMRALMPFDFTNEGVQKWGPAKVAVSKV